MAWHTDWKTNTNPWPVTTNEITRRNPLVKKWYKVIFLVNQEHFWKLDILQLKKRYHFHLILHIITVIKLDSWPKSFCIVSVIVSTFIYIPFDTKKNHLKINSTFMHEIVIFYFDWAKEKVNYDFINWKLKSRSSNV